MKKITKAFSMIFALTFIIFLAVAFYINSGHFIRQQILPLISKKLGQTIRAEEASFSIFSKLELNNVTCGPLANPSFRADSIRARYQFLPLLSKKFYIDELAVENASLELTKKLETNKPSPVQNSATLPKKEKSNNSPFYNDLVIRDIHLKNVDITHTQELPNEQESKTQLKGIDLTLPELAFDKDIDLELLAHVSHKAGSSIDAEAQKAKVSVSGQIDKKFTTNGLTIDAFLQELDGIVGGQVKLDKRQIKISGAFSNKDKNFAIENLLIEDIYHDKKETSILLNGNYDPTQAKANINYSISNLGPSLLNLLLPPLEKNELWLDYQKSLKDSTNNKLTGIGELTLNLQGKIALEQKNLYSEATFSAAKIPAVTNENNFKNLELKLDHKLNYNISSKDIKVHAIDLLLTEGPKRLSQIKGQATSSAKNHSLTLEKANIQSGITEFIPLAFLGDLRLNNANLNMDGLTITQNEKGISLETAISANKFSLSSFTNQFLPINISPQISTQISFDKKNNIAIHNFDLLLSSSFHQPLRINAKGHIDTAFTARDSSNLEIKASDPINIDAIIAMFETQNSKAPSDKEKQIESIDATTKPSSTPKKIASKSKPQFKSSISLALPQLQYQGLMFEDVFLNGVIDGERYELKESTFNIMSTPAKISGHFNTPDTSYEVLLNSEPLEFKPWLELYKPSYTDRLIGKVSFNNFTLKGSESMPFETSGVLNFQNIEANNFAALPAISETNILSFLNLASSSVTDIYSIVISKAIGIDPNKLYFKSGSAQFEFKNNLISIAKSDFSNDNYRLKMAGHFNTKDNSAKVDIDTGISGLVTIDKSVTKHFSEEKDGLRYLPTISVDTGKIKSDGFLKTASGLTGSYFGELIKGIFSGLNIRSAVKEHGKNIFRSITDIILPEAKEKSEPLIEEKPKKPLPKSDSPKQKIIKKLLDKLF